jgi:hypothetical protein
MLSERYVRRTKLGIALNDLLDRRRAIQTMV